MIANPKIKLDFSKKKLICLKDMEILKSQGNGLEKSGRTGKDPKKARNYPKYSKIGKIDKNTGHCGRKGGKKSKSLF